MPAFDRPLRLQPPTGRGRLAAGTAAEPEVLPHDLPQNRWRGPKALTNDNAAWLQKARKEKQEQAEQARARVDELLAARAAIDAELTSLGYEERRPPADVDLRGTRTCSICRAAGLVAESIGHIALGHDRWLAQQPGHIQAHFKGQGDPSDHEPRLIKPQNPV